MKESLIPIIVIITYMFIELIKTIFKKKEELNKLLPVLAGLIGGIISILMFLTLPEIREEFNVWMFLEVGIISGLGSTRTNQIIKKIFNKSEENSSHKNK